MSVSDASCRRLWGTPECNFLITHAVLKGLWRRLGPSWRPLGGCLETFLVLLEASWEGFGAPWRRLGASCRLANNFKASWRRLGGIVCRFEGVLEASWRRLGGVSDLPWRFVFGLGHGIVCCIHCQFSEWFQLVSFRYGNCMLILERSMWSRTG